MSNKYYKLDFGIEVKGGQEEGFFIFFFKKRY
jgi:hypothetical protein